MLEGERRGDYLGKTVQVSSVTEFLCKISAMVYGVLVLISALDYL